MASLYMVGGVATYPFEAILTSIVYDIPPRILSTLTPKEESVEGPRDGDTDITESRSETSESASGSTTSSKACSLCGITFNSVDDQRSHTRSDLHGYNLKRKIRGLSSVTEVEFDELVGG